MRRPRTLCLLAAAAAAALAGAARADEALTLDEAIGRARSQHVDGRIAAATEREAAFRVKQARAGWYPRVDLVEGWQRGDQPVYVFSSLLGQRRFVENNFLIDALNEPEPLENFRSAVVVDYAFFDGGATRGAVAAATASRAMASSSRDQTLAALAEAATHAYGRVLMLEAEQQVSVAAVAAAEADVARARDRRDAGLVTEADLLAFEVHLAKMLEQRIASTGELAVARVQLNQVMGAPLEARYSLVLPAVRELPPVDRSTLEAQALARPEVEQARLRATIATAERSAARAAFLPRFALQGVWEFNGDAFGDRASGWVVGAQMRLNLFNGLADAARLGAARESAQRSVLEREKAETAARVEVLAAGVRLEAAQAREAVGRAAVAQAQESQRILRDRYASGMATVTDVLRAAEAALQAEFQAIGARVDVLVQRAALDRARGQL